MCARRCEERRHGWCGRRAERVAMRKAALGRKRRRRAEMSEMDLAVVGKGMLFWNRLVRKRRMMLGLHRKVI